MSLDELYRQRCETWSDVVDHLPYLHDLVVDENAQTVVEFGVRTGNSTAAFLAACEKTGGHLWSVDVTVPSWPLEFYGTAHGHLVVGDDLQVGDKLPDLIDVLFIDTTHHYDQTLAELRMYGRRARIVLLHDTELERPHQAPGTDPPFPVAAAIEQWCAESGETWTNLTGCYGLGVVTGGA